MKNTPDRKSYEFMKYFFTNPPEYDDVLLYQLGDRIISDGAVVSDHIQQCHEITCVLSGNGTFVTNNVGVPVSRGDIHVVSKGDIHEIIPDISSKLHFVYIGFDFVSEVSNSEMLKIKDFYRNVSGRVFLDNGELAHLLALLVSEWRAENKPSDIFISSLLKCILIQIRRRLELSREETYVQIDKSLPIPKNIDEIISFIGANLDKQLTIKMISEKFGYTENYLSHLFKNKTGMSIHKYITGKKIELAADLLLNSGITVDEISRAMGYASSRSFGRMFRQSMGCTPSKFRSELSGYQGSLSEKYRRIYSDMT